MKAEDVKALEPILLTNLTRAIDFVKFGEAKNAALLTFASAWLLASANLVMNPAARGIPRILWGVIYGAPFIGIAVFFAVLSFFPRDSLKSFLPKDPDPTNLVFFGHLGALEPKEGFQRIADRYLNATGRGELTEAYLCDLGCQIVVNSKIASWKFSLFRKGVFALLVGLLIYFFHAVLLVLDRAF